MNHPTRTLSHDEPYQRVPLSNNTVGARRGRGEAAGRGVERSTRGTVRALLASRRRSMNRNCSPLYSFIRRQGRSSEDAQDLTQGYFDCLLEKDFLADFEPERGRFRTFRWFREVEYQPILLRTPSRHVALRTPPRGTSGKRECARLLGGRSSHGG